MHGGPSTIQIKLPQTGLVQYRHSLAVMAPTHEPRTSFNPPSEQGGLGIVYVNPTEGAVESTPHHYPCPWIYTTARAHTMLPSSGLKAILLSSSLVTLVGEALGAPAQQPLQLPSSNDASERVRKPRGRFLHITDMHPDPWYEEDASESSACHRRKPKKERVRAGYYGTPYSDCDSPFTLTNYTLDYLDKHWSDEIDFVVWTGDNARHDNDRKRPRTTDEIYELNRAVAQKMEEVFVSRGVPVIPSLGNNDIWPHNIFLPGPNSITNEFASIWRSFIPFPYYQTFQRGAYYSVEVIPDSLAVISLNTLYFYDSNKAVGGCEYREPGDPGNLQFDWLDVQLDMFRERGMKVWLTGHVPPSPGNYFPECYVRYVELSLRYQDTVLGHLYGHMNIDHFSFVEADDLEIPGPPSSIQGEGAGGVGALKKHDRLYQALIKDFSELPKSAKKIKYDEYAVINVSPSVVPNPYMPSFRVFVYNATGEPQRAMTKGREHGHRREKGGEKKRECEKGGSEWRDTWWCRLTKRWHSDEEAPSRRNTLWTPLGYAQYTVRKSKLETANAKHGKGRPKFKLEYTTLPLEALHAREVGFGGGYAIPMRELPRSVRNETVSESKYAPYGMADLTIPSWVDLARRLGSGEEKGLRRRFRRYMYMGGEYVGD